MNSQPTPYNSWAIKVFIAIPLLGIAVAIVANRVTADRAAVKAKAEAKAVEDAEAETRAKALRNPPTPEPETLPVREPITKIGLLPPAAKAPPESPTTPPSLPESAPAVALPEKAPDGDLQLHWLLACSAMLFEASKESHDTLAGAPLTEQTRELNRTRLKKFWSITTTAELNQTIAGLEARRRSDGCRALTAKCPKISDAEAETARANVANIDAWFTLRMRSGRNDPNFLVAWDYGRAMNITRLGYAAGLLTEAEALAHLKRLGPQMQACYESWSAMGLDYALGYELWSNGGTRRNIFHQLITRPDSPWKALRWDLDLKAAAPR